MQEVAAAPPSCSGMAGSRMPDRGQPWRGRRCSTARPTVSASSALALAVDNPATRTDYLSGQSQRLAGGWTDFTTADGRFAIADAAPRRTARTCRCRGRRR